MKRLMLVVVLCACSGCWISWIPIPVPTPTPIPVPTPTNPVPPAVVYEYIPGDVRDKGKDIWQFVSGMDVRLSANDIKNLMAVGIPAKGAWYPLAPEVMEGLTVTATADGGLEAHGRDFTSARTGLKYHLCGYYVSVTTTPAAFRPGFDLRLSKAECHGTLRPMYATVK